jgi:hypothetical protein
MKVQGAWLVDSMKSWKHEKKFGKTVHSICCMYCINAMLMNLFISTIILLSIKLELLRN